MFPSEATVRPGGANPLPFAVGPWPFAVGCLSRPRRSGYVMSIRELSEGWSAQLGPGSSGSKTSFGRYLAIVTPHRDAKDGRHIVDVTDTESGEVCPVEWYCGARVDGNAEADMEGTARSP